PLAPQVLSGGQLQQSLARRTVHDLDLLDGIAAAEDHVAPAHLMDQLVADLVVEELERPRPLIDDRDLHAKRREHGRIFDPDYAGAHDGHRARQMFEAQYGVRARDRPIVAIDARRAAW